MSKKNTSSETSKDENGIKTEERTSPPKKEGGMHKAFIAIAVVFVVIVGSIVAYYALDLRGSDAGSDDDGNTPPGTDDVPGGDAVKIENVDNKLVGIPLSSVNETAKFFNYNISGAEVQIFAVKDGNGTVHMAMNACPKCYKKHAGFQQQGDIMMEMCCKMPYPIDKINLATCALNVSGCHPTYLKFVVNGSKVTFAKSDLAAGAYLFAGNEFAKVESVDIKNVAIPLSSVSETATWYKYNVSGATVRFVAVKDSTGAIHTVFDSCPKCYKKHAGLRQEGANLTENCCNMGYPITGINATSCALNKTGCHPAYLKCIVNGSRVVIAKSDLAGGAYLFKTTNESALIEEYDIDSIAIPLSSVSQIAGWYVYRINGTDVRFIAVKDGNGTVHTVFDTCAKCYKKHAGLRQDGSTLVENCCNMGYPIDKLNADTCGIENKACHPLFLPSSVIGDKVVIDKADLMAYSHLFKT